MAGIGLGWSAGNDAMAQNIRQQIADQLMAEQRKKQDAQQAFENDLKTKQFQSNEDLKNAQLAALIDQRSQGNADRQSGRLTAQNEQIAPGTDLPLASPLVQAQKAGGNDYLYPDKPDAVPNPPDALAANPDAGPQSLPGTILNAPSPMAGRLVVKGATQNQAEKAINDKRQADIEARDTAYKNSDLAIKQQLADQAGAKQPRDPVSHYSILSQTGADGAQLPPMAFDSLTGTARGIPGVGANKASPAAPGAAQSARQAKAAQFALGDVESVQQQLDAADKAGLIGPGAGRVNGQFLAGLIGSTGNPEADRQLGGLKAAITDLKTSYPMAISGTARGGGGATDRLQSVLNSDKLSADLMHGALDEIRGSLTRRAGTKPDDGGAVPSVGGTFQGGKVLKVEKVQ